MKAFVAQPIQPNGIEILKTVAEVTVNERGRCLTREEFLDEIRDVDALVIPWQSDVVDAEAISMAKNLKAVGRQGVGYENIDVQAATQNGIYVTYTPVHTPTVADMAFGLMLCAARRIHTADRFVKQGGWDIEGEWIPLQFLGVDIHHKTIGIIGCGRIGGEIAKRARGFDMTILYHDRVANEAVERDLGARRVPLETLLRESDFIHVNCSLNEDTHHLVSAPEFALMKETAVVVNTARGPVVDQRALCEALKHQKIVAAGLDVFEQEPIAADDALLELDNVVAVPHIGSAALETRQRMAEIVCQDAVNILTGNMPVYLLNPDVVKVRPLSKE
jgi:lactate dehydrogenase-like 2-hydroxyacid dehydrogenase